ncbi:MAG: IclR family transcriptional regulator [Paracoccaceae bacterium]|nr:IclR family transcriptional regulator [Paracoccaceae bacterium]
MNQIKRVTSYHAQALTRGLDILRFLGASPNKTEGLNSLHRITGLPKSTLVRLLTVLENHRFIVKISDQNLYRLGSAVVDLASAYNKNSAIRERSTPFLRELASKFGHTVELGMLESSKVTLINVQQSDRNLRFNSIIGSTWPINCTSLGKILLAGLNKNIAREILMKVHSFEKRTTYTLTSTQEIMADVARSKVRGYAISCEEHDKGVCALGVPIRTSKRTLNWNAALSITGPIGEMSDKNKKVLVNQLNETALLISCDPEIQSTLRVA